MKRMLISTLLALVLHAPVLGAADFEVESIASGLEIPWDMAFAPDGRIFVTERPGRIRVIEDGLLRDAPWATLDVANWRAAGLSGLALSPNFDHDRYVFVMGTFGDPDTGFVNRIYRFNDADGVGVNPTQLVDDIPSIDTHAGGALDFGPDGKLYAAVGDIEDIALVQDPNNTVGKILRFNADGSVPDDNPFPGSPVWALGLRNPQGLTWHPETHALYATEHGPSGFPEEGYREHQDELNRITRGGNYGWPIVSGMHQDQRFLKPLVEWTPAIAPSGLAMVTDPDSSWYGNLVVGALRAQHLRRVVLNGEGAIDSEEVLFEGAFGRIRLVAEGPDGYVYFSTSNIDTPGEPKRGISRPEDDQIYRLRVK